MADVVIIQETPETVIVQSDSTSVDVYEGIPISGGGDLHYSQSFTAQTSVSVQHNLGKRPAVTVINSAGDEVVGEIDHISNNELLLTFSSAFTGTVLLN